MVTMSIELELAGVVMRSHVIRTSHRAAAHTVAVRSVANNVFDCFRMLHALPFFHAYVTR